MKSLRTIYCEQHHVILSQDYNYKSKAVYAEAKGSIKNTPRTVILKHI